MNAITFGLQALLVSAFGWLIVRLLLRDARHRAWGALIALAALVCVPWIPDFGGKGTAVSEAALIPLPQWKVTVSPALAPSPIVDLGPSEMASIWQLPHWTALVLGAWGAGAVMLGLLHAWRTLQAARLKVQPHPRGVFTAGVASPCVVGLFRPVIVVPTGCEWSDDQWRWTLAHESEHLRGQDTRVVWLLGWLRVALWWNPFVHSLIETWEQAREEICDHAASLRNEAASYSEFLLSIASAQRLPGVAMAASRPARRLRARLLSLLEGRGVRRGPHWLFVVLAVASLALGVMIASCVRVQTAPEAVDSEPQVTRIFRVGPRFLTTVDSTPQTARQILERAGVDFPSGASAVFNPVTSQLIVKNTPRRLDQVETVVAAMAARQDLADMQVYMTTKWVECPEDTPLPHDLQILTDPQLQVLIRALGQKKGIDLLNGPSVTCKLGQLATVEVVRELVRPGSAMDWVGTRTEVTTLFHQGKLLLSLHPELGLPMKNGQRVKGSFDPDKSITVQHLSRRESVAIDDGHTVALYIGSPEPGRKVVFFVTAALIAPSGARVDIKELRRQQELGDSVKIAPPQAAAPSPAPEGKVRVRTHIFRGKTADALAKVFPGLKPESQVPPEPKSPILPTPNYTAAPMPFTLEGILTDPQLKTLLAAAQTKQDLSIDVWPEAVIPTGKDTTLPNQSGHELHVTPVLGPDGNTVDLTISILKFPPDRRTSVQTSVTIWDGQTVILGGDTEMICLTVDKVK